VPSTSRTWRVMAHSPGERSPGEWARQLPAGF